MAKQIIWTNTAKKSRREILQYWIDHNRSDIYSKKLEFGTIEEIPMTCLKTWI